MSESGSKPEPQEGPGSAPGAPSEPAESDLQRDSVTAKDPLRGSRASGVWGAVVALVVLLILLSVFILQNTGSVEISYFGWQGEAPLAAALLIAVAAGLLIAVIAGSLRILQLRRRVRREQKR
jgi:uncharacterized integral membrane protein